MEAKKRDEELGSRNESNMIATLQTTATTATRHVYANAK